MRAATFIGLLALWEFLGCGDDTQPNAMPPDAGASQDGPDGNVDAPAGMTCDPLRADCPESQPFCNYAIDNSGNRCDTFCLAQCTESPFHTVPSDCTLGNAPNNCQSDRPYCCRRPDQQVKVCSDHPLAGWYCCGAEPHIDGGVSPDFTGMVMVPAGQFWMGCNSAIQAQCDQRPAELPYHIVTLAAFAIDKTEVSQADYKSCMDAGPCSAPARGFDPQTHGSFPVANVLWSQARDYCRWKRKRLPTEAEWEKAARGTDGRVYPWGNAQPSCPGGLCCCSTTPEAVGTYPSGASPYGALDMSGNVREWVADPYDANYYVTATAIDPPGPACGTLRVLRGGGANEGGVALETSYRSAPGWGPDAIVGFRCVASQ